MCARANCRISELPRTFLRALSSRRAGVGFSVRRDTEEKNSKIKPGWIKGSGLFPDGRQGGETAARAHAPVNAERDARVTAGRKEAEEEGWGVCVPRGGVVKEEKHEEVLRPARPAHFLFSLRIFSFLSPRGTDSSALGRSDVLSGLRAPVPDGRTVEEGRLSRTCPDAVLRK